MFIKTQTRKTKNDDEDLFDEESGDIVNQFNECLEEREDHEQDEDYREEVFTRVMGHDAHGRICMYEIDLQSKYNEVSSKLHLVVTHIGLQVNTSASESGHFGWKVMMESLDHN
ncbi:hypothetical protein ACFX14_007014 [Malus domestica]